jgi:predicted transcriptional regulator
MKAKILEKMKAVKLRETGSSISDISKILCVSRGSVSAWVKDVEISTSKKEILDRRSHSTEAVEKRRQTRLKNEKNKREALMHEASLEVSSVSRRELWLIGTMLYWAEGGKTQRMVRFSNGDPEMIRTMIQYFTVVCEVDEAKLRGYIHIHDHLDVDASEKYWQKVSGIPGGQFYKTYRKPMTPSKRRTLPYGVMDIYILDVKLFLKIKGWTMGIYENINNPSTAGIDHSMDD